MSPAMRNRAPSDTEILADVVAVLRARLPTTWDISERREPPSPARRRDAELLIAVPPDMTARLNVEIKLAPTPKSMVEVVARLRSAGPAERSRATTSTMLLGVGASLISTLSRAVMSGGTAISSSASRRRAGEGGSRRSEMSQVVGRRARSTATTSARISVSEGALFLMAGDIATSGTRQGRARRGRRQYLVRRSCGSRGGSVGRGIVLGGI